MALQTISESVYVGLCLHIGTQQQVDIRRDAEDMEELLHYIQIRTGSMPKILSGSRREGFRLEDSDMDMMFWLDDHRVLWDFSQAMLYNTHRYVLILCDSSESPPGFTLLWIPLERAHLLVASSCVRINGSLYISSAKYRDNTCTVIRPDSTVHGPCSSGKCSAFNIEYDHAHCFVSDFWPPSAYSWIDRCHTWPLPRVIDDIIRRGCHFVAIGHKLGKHADNEWRISFSQAEQKLVYSMNHTQFLTYGLLKLFVKEFNNGLIEDEKLLCSYHMKTAIFWAIQQNTIAHWCPQNLLAGFWVCFKLLLMWVYQGVCPNFFIPENNMFLNKVYGVAQHNLFTRLYCLYEKGIAFLLQIPSIKPYIINVLCNPRLSVCTNENALISEIVVDNEFFIKSVGCDKISPHDKYWIMESINVMKQLIKSPLNQYQIPILQRFVTTTLRSCAFAFHDMYINTSRVNKYLYVVEKMACYMLKWSAKFGCVSDSLYMAMFFYKTFRHKEALSVIEMTKVKLAQPGLMWGGVVNATRYIEAVGGKSWSSKMRHAVAHDIILRSNICYINELTPEQQSGAQNGELCLLIPPHVLLYMLEFLCCRHVDPMRAEAALDHLQIIVHNDPGVFVRIELKDISWEILGICQQMTGNHQAALYSYRQSLIQVPVHKIHTATTQRIQDLL